MFHPVVKIKVYNEELVFGPGLSMLLGHIKETGSMKEACSAMGMSYSKGWKIVNRAEKELEYALITRQHGGSRGGKCEITPKGAALIQPYEKLEKDVQEYTKKIFLEYFPEYDCCADNQLGEVQ